LAKYGDEIVEEMSKSYASSFMAEIPNVPVEMVDQKAAEWARANAGDWVNGVSSRSKARVRKIIADGVKNGERVDSGTKSIKRSRVFSKKRANMIART